MGLGDKGELVDGAEVRRYARSMSVIDGSPCETTSIWLTGYAKNIDLGDLGGMGPMERMGDMGVMGRVAIRCSSTLAWCALELPFED